MKRAKRIICLSLVFLNILFTLIGFSSCKEKNREYDPEEVVTAAKELLSRCELLNTVYYGEGINYISSSHQNGVYKEADFIHLQKLGFKTLEELKALTKRVYSERLCNEIFKNKFNTKVTEENGELGRYYQKYSEDKNGVITEPLCIMVNTSSVQIFDDRMTYDFSSVKALRSEGQLVYIEVTCEVKSKEGESQLQSLEIALIEEEEGWRIASHTTFCNYNPYKDKYEDLLGK